MIDDWRFKLLDWSKGNDLLAIGLCEEIYLFNQRTNEKRRLIPLEKDENNNKKMVTTISWGEAKSSNQNLLSYGDTSGKVNLIDIEAEKRIRTLNSHNSEILTISTCHSILSSGSSDKRLIHHDLRAPKSSITCKMRLESSIISSQWNPS